MSKKDGLKKSRAAAIVVDNGAIALLQRIHPEGHIQYGFPGGKVQEGEDIPSAIQREVLEELGLEVEVGKLIATIYHKNQMQYYCLATVVGGIFGSGAGPEFQRAERGDYVAVWIPIAELAGLPIEPAILVAYLQESYAGGWQGFQHFDHVH